MALACADIHGLITPVRSAVEVLVRLDVRSSQVTHVNVVADTGSIRGVVVSAENGYLSIEISLRPNNAHTRCHHDWEQVRLRHVVLTDFAARVRAACIEV